jgi:hypothetical protein
MYSRVPKKVVVETELPDFFVVTLEELTEEDDDASSAIELLPVGFMGTRERPKSHSFV